MPPMPCICAVERGMFSPQKIGKPITRVVSFGENLVKKFDADSTVTVRSNPQIENKSIIGELMESITACHLVLKDAVAKITREKWTDLYNLFKRGEIVTYVDSRNNKKWAFTWDFLDKLCRHRTLENGIRITKRGFTIAELLRRSPRKLDHQEYTNSLLQAVYAHLTPSLRMKTDAGWMEYRMKSRRKWLVATAPPSPIRAA
mmetsp:Transcript_20036/g.28203  ORF Transcript_20036/g.28203 Transcript_20036/m.28203 type:complete len:202 (-) Transcript_20036:434-1039(-)